MCINGVLASVDVNRLAKAHLCVYKEMKKRTASGRYICYDKIIQSQDDIQELAHKTGRDINIMTEIAVTNRPRFELSNTKISNLMSRTFKCNQ